MTMNQGVLSGVFLDTETLSLATLDTTALKALDVELRCYKSSCADEVVSRIKDASFILVNKVNLNRDVLQHAKALKYIGVTATGINNIDTEYCAQQNICVRNVTAYGTESVAQHTLMLLLNLVTNFPRYHNDVQQGNWSSSEHFCLNQYPVTTLSGKHAVVVGHGELGQRVDALFNAFGMRVSIAARPGKENDDRPTLDSLLPTADVVSLHCPLTKDNEKLINARTLALMKPSAVLINTARGGLVDEAALLRALKLNKLGGAALDVISEEPPSPEHILMSNPMPNLLISPHNAWIAQSARQHLLDKTVSQLQEFLASQS